MDIISHEVLELEEASTHKSLTTRSGAVFMPRDLDLNLLAPKINGFPGFIVECFDFKFDDPSCIDALSC